MKRKTWLAGLGAALLSAVCSAQSLTPKWEELTAEDFVKAISQARGVCLLPAGVIEKHGPAGPLGVDMLNVRYSALTAAAQEYAVVFPHYYVGQIFEAKHQPGTIAYSARLQMDMLEESVSEMARNGCKKVVLVNGHGGNTALFQYFIQTTLASPKDHVVYLYTGQGGAAQPVPAAAKPSRPGVDGHGGESEIAVVMASTPGSAYPERSGRQSGADQKRLELPPGVSTAIGWYASYPHHYQGDSSGATAERGEALNKLGAARLAAAIKAIKSDEAAPRLQKQFFDESARPLETRQ